MQNEITKPSDLLDARGALLQRGWARDLLLKYDRAAVRAPKFKLKEWDYYCVLAGDHGAAFTVADNGYMGFVAATLFDFTAPRHISKSVMVPFPMGSFTMPASSKEGDVSFKKKGLSLEFLRRPGKRIIRVDWKDFQKKTPLAGEIALAQPDDIDSMVIATPFAGAPRAFYYNQKINCLGADGALDFGGKRFAFSPVKDFGVLDWGRGVWTYSNTWYWGSGSGIAGGGPFGFNIGYGFGDTSAATENMLFYRGKAHKLEHVSFHIPDDSFMKPWKFSSSDGRFEMDFVPILDRSQSDNVLLIKSDQHQVFGRFTGRAVLDDGRVLDIKDFLGFAEKVINRW
ncbi:MAG TPA: DUF2804 domain-containing protein [Spirochaetota bacterium]|nr:DUF2804 domain-containing protein [Spirochaetota bacterium]